jgi:hypothetical protein
MKFHVAAVVAVLMGVSSLLANPAGAAQKPAAEYAQHFDPLAKLSVEVAKAMPADQYEFRPHSEPMNFGELMLHIASTNYAFCAGLKDSGSPSTPSPAAADEEAVVKFLSLPSNIAQS